MTMTEASLIVVRQGEKTIALPGRRSIVARAGEAVALSAGLTVDVTNALAGTDCYSAEVISFGSDVMQGRAANGGSLPEAGHLLLSDGLAESFERCRIALSDTVKLPETIRQSRLNELLLWIESQGVRLRPAAKSLALTVQTLVQSDPAQKWSTHSVLAALGRQGDAMSEATLRRRLRQEKASLNTLIIDARMTVALALLQATDRPIAAIALDCGYDSPSRFAIRFRARFGIAPSSLRGHKRLSDRIGTEIERLSVALMAAE